MRGYNRLRNAVGENKPFVGEVHFGAPLDSACRFHFSYSALDSGSSRNDFFTRNQNRFGHLSGKAIPLTVRSGTKGCFQSHLNPGSVRNGVGLSGLAVGETSKGKGCYRHQAGYEAL